MKPVTFSIFPAKRALGSMSLKSERVGATSMRGMRIVGPSARRLGASKSVKAQIRRGPPANFDMHQNAPTIRVAALPCHVAHGSHRSQACLQGRRSIRRTRSSPETRAWAFYGRVRSLIGRFADG